MRMFSIARAIASLGSICALGVALLLATGCSGRAGGMSAMHGSLCGTWRIVSRTMPDGTVVASSEDSLVIFTDEVGRGQHVVVGDSSSPRGRTRHVREFAYLYDGTNLLSCAFWSLKSPFLFGEVCTYALQSLNEKDMILVIRGSETKCWRIGVPETTVQHDEYVGTIVRLRRVKRRLSADRATSRQATNGVLRRRAGAPPKTGVLEMLVLIRGVSASDHGFRQSIKELRRRNGSNTGFGGGLRACS